MGKNEKNILPETPETFEVFEGSGFCIDCGLNVASFINLSECPSCGSKNIPCLDSQQVNISINWYELKILCTWAEQWEHEKVKNAGIIYAIANRISTQYPNKTPLTLAEEVQNLSKKYKVTTNVPGVEINKNNQVT